MLGFVLFQIVSLLIENIREKWNSLDNGKTAVHSIIANQLALMIVLFSPLQMASDLPENYQDNPAFAFIENLPTSWDETKVLAAYIGEYVVTARRKGTALYFGSINNEIPREISVPLSMLSLRKKYQATIYSDNYKAHYETNPEAIDITSSILNSSDTLNLKLVACGGVAIKFNESKK
ncbi:MAG: glycoside hydrolase family 97 C-terminal domain-containing protein [Bacteroidota bacterium]